MSDPASQRALAIILRQKKVLSELDSDLATQIPMWRDRTTRMLSTVVVKAELALMSRVQTKTWTGDREALLRFLADLEAGIKEAPDLYLVAESERQITTTPSAASLKPPGYGAPNSRYVFVVHGHDSLAKLDVARTLEKLRLTPIVLHEQANEGKTIIEKFERDAARAGFAVVLLTPDDLGYPYGKPDDLRARARQNVILELGYFSAALGRSHVCVLYKGDVELPSDYLGVIYVPMDDSGNWRFALAKELKHAGMEIDLNDLV